jgi:hypothetical protein
VVEHLDALERRLQGRRLAEVSGRDLDREVSQRPAVAPGAGKDTDLDAVLQQSPHDLAPHEAGPTGDEGPHRRLRPT